jgi:ribonuclease HI
MKYFVDASCTKRRNCIAISDSQGNIIFFKRINTRKYTNNEMEYKAIIEGLSYANPNDRISSDAKICVEQIHNNFNTNAQNLIPLRDQAQRLLMTNPSVKLIWEKRENNLAGIYLEKYIKRLYHRRIYRKKFRILNCNLLPS